jgi:hypothetical protein
MANIDIDKNEKMGEEELEQVKGGLNFTKIGDIKGEKEGFVGTTTQVAGYDLKAAKKV